jgi:imidazolonepropionase-like amidohydrolase
VDRTLITNARLLDVELGDYRTGTALLIGGERIVEVGGVPPSAKDAVEIDARDRVVMPGLIDAHVHPMLSSMDVGSLLYEPVTLLAQRARHALESMLQRGFTTGRDACGGDRGLVRASELGLIRGPRLFVSGRALSQTGGHGDVWPEHGSCGAVHAGPFSRVADGVDEVRKAAREELRAGAHQLKIMASGGVASPTDEIWTLQYSVEEMAAVVEEAAARRTYVLAHAYTAEAIRRAVAAGARSIEHGNLIDTFAAQLMAERGAVLVPTLVAYEKIYELGDELGMPAAQRRKVVDVIDQGLGSLKIARDAGVPIGFGTDLLGEAQVHQSDEFRIRARVEDPVDVIRSATVVNAALVGLEGQVGMLAPGALADLLIVDGDPLDDVSVLADPERIDLVMRAGEICHPR